MTSDQQDVEVRALAGKSIGEVLGLLRERQGTAAAGLVAEGYVQGVLLWLAEEIGPDAALGVMRRAYIPLSPDENPRTIFGAGLGPSGEARKAS